jgi:hypothetical protein
MLGAGEAFTDAPFFWSVHYDAIVNYVGHAEKIETIVTDGSPENRDFAARFESASGMLMALATIFRDQQSLEAEVAIERGESI